MSVSTGGARRSGTRAVAAKLGHLLTSGRRAGRWGVAWGLLTLPVLTAGCGRHDSVSPVVDQTLDPTSLSASATDGEPGLPTELVVQARDTEGRPYLGPMTGLALEVRGRNADTVTDATNNGDGTFTLSYTPAEMGFDTLIATHDGATIQGTPLASRVRVVWVAASGTATVDGVVEPGEWDAATAYPVFAGPILTGSTARFMADASNLYVLITYPDSVASVAVRFDNALDLLLDGDDAIGGGATFFFDQHFTPDGLRNDDMAEGQAGATATSFGSVVELSHPLDSGDPQDVALAGAVRVGACLVAGVGGSGSDIADPGGCLEVSSQQMDYAELDLP